MKITIFGLEGTGTSSVGKLLAESMGYEFKSAGNIMRDMANDEGITLEEFNTNRLVKIKKGEENGEADKEIDSYIKKFGEENDCFVFEGRLPWYLISDAFKIKLICSDDIRCRRVAIRDGITQEKAYENSIRRQEENKEVFKRIYNMVNYPPDDLVFDLVIDTGIMHPEELVKEILSKVE